MVKKESNRVVYLVSVLGHPEPPELIGLFESQYLQVISWLWMIQWWAPLGLLLHFQRSDSIYSLFSDIFIELYPTCTSFLILIFKQFLEMEQLYYLDRRITDIF